jgi:6-phosphogluconolactonase/glucosamine-6-phosphate isomerase/deaminase
LAKLTVAQTDERFGPLGHKDSNWQQMQDDGFDFSGITTIPILTGASLEQTVGTYGAKIEQAFKDAAIVVGQFGMGADGHIAGMLPHSSAIDSKDAVAAFTDVQFTRVTLTPRMLRQIHASYAFVFGESKKAAVQKLQKESLDIHEMPAQLLKEMQNVHFYSDQLK